MAINENILVDQAWGVFPQSRRRRRSALIMWLRPTIAFVLGVVIFSLIGFISNGRFYLSGLFTPVIAVAAWCCVLMPFFMESRYSNARILAANRPDYDMAGFRGREMLKGIAAPQLASVKMFAGVLSITVAFLSLIVPGPPIEGRLIAAAIIPAFFITCVLPWSLFSIGLWAKYPSRGARVFFSLLMLLTSPLMIGCAAMPFFYNQDDYSGLIVMPLLCFEMPALVFRLAFCSAAWTRAIDIVDGREEAWREPVNPIETSPWSDDESGRSRLRPDSEINSES